MAQYDDTNRFTLFRNDKQGNEKRPDYTGKINIDGTEYRLSAWIKDGQKGKFMSGSVEPFQDRQTKPVPQDDPFADEDLPF